MPYRLMEVLMNKDNLFYRLSVLFLKSSLREQVLIWLSGWVVIGLLAYTFLLEANLEQSIKLKRDISLAESKQVDLKQQVVEIQGHFKNDPNQEIRQRIEDLNKEITLIDSKLQEKISNLVPANQMASMLESVLAESGGIKLIELSSIAPTPIFLSKQDDDKQAQADLYRHGVSLMLEGSYFDIQSYLKKLESLQWKFYWKKFDYNVDTYPKGKIELEIYTLSISKAFIGV